MLETGCCRKQIKAIILISSLIISMEGKNKTKELLNNKRKKSNLAVKVILSSCQEKMTMDVKIQLKSVKPVAEQSFFHICMSVLCRTYSVPSFL